MNRGLVVTVSTSLAGQLLNGERRSLARLITLLERGDASIPEVMDHLHPHTGKAYIIGVTGAPGAGKSTLVDHLIQLLREQGQQVGILAVDPTSPFSGGAVLGDRIRMQRHYLDSEVFIRSLATRGNPGGLSRVTRGAIKLLDAYGCDTIIVETVGVGQTELEVMEVVDSVAVVLVPEGGDSIQIMKAGLMEVADIFVINKADRGGAETMASEIRTALNMAEKKPWWRPPILLTQAHQNVGVQELYDSIQRHHREQEESSRLAERRRQRRRIEFLKSLEEEFRSRIHEMLEGETEVAALIQRVDADQTDAFAAARKAFDDGALVRSLWQHLQKSSQSTP